MSDLNLPILGGGAPGVVLDATTIQYPAVSSGDYVNNNFVQSSATAPLSGPEVKSYYFAGAQLIAVRTQIGSASTLNFLHSDHLGSTSLATDANGAVVPNSRQLYDAWGNLRVKGTGLPTDVGYTGQRLDTTGLMYYRARYYDPSLNRFISADTIVPNAENPQDLNRYSYARNSPLKYTDPTGHICVFGIGSCANEEDIGWKGLALVVGAVSQVWGNATTTVKTVQAAATSTVNNTQAALSGYPFGQTRVAAPEGTNDLTDWLIDQMNTNATGAIAQTLRDANNGNIDQKYGALLGWAGLVKTGGPWDFKPALSQRGLKEVVLDGQVYLDQVVANIHYGYVGRASGFAQIDLLSGAGVAQLKDHFNDGNYGSLLYFFDEPHDRAAIMVGIYLWDHYNGQMLTQEMLQDALSHFEEFRDYPIPGIPLKINNK